MPAITIQFDRRRLLRALALTWVIGTAAAALFAWGAGARRSPLARLLGAWGIPPAAAAFALVEGVTVAAVVYGLGHALRRRHRIRLRTEGLEVLDSLGEYLIAWDNLEASTALPGPLAGLRWRDPARVLETHRGTDAQRELLATREPVNGCDVAFSREELDREIEPFLELVERYRQHPERRAELAEGADG